MALPTTNIKISDAKNAISETTYALKQLCISSKINQWALHKPANYGAGNDAWTTASTLTGYVIPSGVSSNSTGHRLGDFRGYDHSALPPRYFDGNVTMSYYRYEPLPSTTIIIKKGSLYPTSNGDGFDPNYYVLDLGSGVSSVGAKLNINNGDYGSVHEIKQSTGDLSIAYTTNIISGTVALKAYYWVRPDAGTAYTKSVEIEGGSKTLTVTQLSPRLHVSNASVTPTGGTTAVEYDTVTQNYTYSFDLQNTSSNGVSIIFGWEIVEYGTTTVVHSGQTQHTVAANATESETLQLNSIGLDGGAFGTDTLYTLRLRSYGGTEIIPNSSVTITITVV